MTPKLQTMKGLPSNFPMGVQGVESCAPRYTSPRLLYAVAPSDLAPSGSGMHLYSYRIG